MSVPVRTCPLLSARGACNLWKSLELLDRQAARVGLITRRSQVQILAPLQKLRRVTIRRDPIRRCGSPPADRTSREPDAAPETGRRARVTSPARALSMAPVALWPERIETLRHVARTCPPSRRSHQVLPSWVVHAARLSRARPRTPSPRARAGAASGFGCKLRAVAEERGSRGRESDAT